MKNRSQLIFWALLLPFLGFAQNNTFSPYSRYGLGEMAQSTFAHNMAMGGTFVALKPDSTMPIFINAGNPAAYALIKMTALEVGGSGTYSKFSGNNSSLTKWSTNFAYGALGFPVAKSGGACFGIMPYSNVGYDLKNTVEENGIGSVNYFYSGSGGLNKAFLGYGVMPFVKKLVKFRTKQAYLADSLKTLKGAKYKMIETGAKLLSDFSVGFNVNYLFGNLQNTTRVEFPNSQLYNSTYRDRSLIMGDFTGNFGAQTAMTIDSVMDHKGRNKKIDNEIAALKTLGVFSDSALELKKDSLKKISPSFKKALQEKVKFTFGYFASLNNALNVNYSSTVYNYLLNGAGTPIVRDTVVYNTNESSTIKMPLEQGFGIGFKKGERINAVADFAITNWQDFKYLDNLSDLKNNYRVALGINYVPEKYAAGRNAFLRRVNYRFGVSYQTGYINIKNTLISNYSITAGLGLPVGIGRLSSMVNLSVQFGQVGTNENNLTKENYLKFNFGFTFCDRWFQKMREN